MQAIAPLPLIVCATGIPNSEANPSSSAYACERWMPPPARISGRRARGSAGRRPRRWPRGRDGSATSARRRRRGRRGTRRARTRTRRGRRLRGCRGRRAPDGRTSRSRTRAGPARECAARPRCAGTPCRPARAGAAWRLSCVIPLPECSRCVSPTIAIMGMPAFLASTRAVTRLVAPGPRVASHSPTRPETRANPSAMNAPQRSSLTR